MAIKQIQLFDSVRAKHNLEAAQKYCNEQVPADLGADQMDIDQLGVLDYLNHERDRWEHIQAQEKELSDLIADKWEVIATYHLGEGVAGCQMILYRDQEGENLRAQADDYRSKCQSVATNDHA